MNGEILGGGWGEFFRLFLALLLPSFDLSPQLMLY